MRPVGWALILSAWCSCKKRNFEHTEKHQGCKSMWRHNEKGGHLQAKERGFRRYQTWWDLGLGLLTYRTMRKLISVILTSHSMVFCYGSLSKPLQQVTTRQHSDTAYTWLHSCYAEQLEFKRQNPHHSLHNKASCDRCGNWGSSWLSHVPQIAHPHSVRARIHSRSVWFLSS